MVPEGNHSRRQFLAASLSTALISFFAFCTRKPSVMTKTPKNNMAGNTRVVRAINGSPAENVRKVLELCGGVQSIIGGNDIVIIKPNLQWWNQGAPNIAASHALVETIMERPGGFTGEVIFGENTHRGGKPWMKTGWAKQFKVNSDLPGIENYNDLCSMLKKKYSTRFSVSHWIDVDSGGKRVFGPQDGPGYVYCDGTGGVPRISLDNGLTGDKRREVVMSYPIFETDSRTIIDFRNGVWEEGSYSVQPIKFINLAALNHHSAYCGMTSSVKNYFGISDLSNGPNPHSGGKLTADFYNFHSFAFDEWAKGPAPGMLGVEVGMFMQKIRNADLNITTAEWIGLSSRTDTPVAHTRAVLASTDPVALDYHSAKYILYPNSHCRHHNPDGDESPLGQYLLKCSEVIDCCISESLVRVASFDFFINEMQPRTDIPVYGNVKWGNDVKALIKYLLFRFLSAFQS